MKYFYRATRYYICLDRNRHGLGILMFVHESLVPKVVACGPCDLEFLLISLCNHVSSCKNHGGLFYRSPSSGVQCLQSLYTYFERFDSSSIVKAEEWAGKTEWMSRKDGQIEVERGRLVWELLAKPSLEHPAEMWWPYGKIANKNLEAVQEKWASGCWEQVGQYLEWQ